MCAEKEKPKMIPSILKMKCPNCREGHMYKNKSVFPLNHMLDMPERCPVCGQKMELEAGFYFGTGYVSYAISVFFFIFNLIWYWLLIGISYKDNSIIYYLITSTVIVALFQPWIMRLSRVIYLYIFVKYGEGTTMKSEE